MYRGNDGTDRTERTSGAEDGVGKSSRRSSDPDDGIVLDYATVRAGMREVNRRISVADEIDSVTAMYG